MRSKLILALALIFISPLYATEFAYKFSAGDRYRILSTVSADIFIDRVLSFRGETVNRISVEVAEVLGDRAFHKATLQTAQMTIPIADVDSDIRTRVYEWDNDYLTEYWQDSLGYMTVEDRFFKPMVRDVPVFPGRLLQVGDTWTSNGIEVQDFREGFGIEEPVHLPFIANYTYLGLRPWKGINYEAFSVSYRIFHELPPAPAARTPGPGPSVPPGMSLRRIQGASDQIIYFNTELGTVVAYEEYFRTILTLADGFTWESRGRAEAEIFESLPMDRENMAREIARDLSDIDDVQVRISDEGIVISLENIQFIADSAVMLPGEMQKLEIVAEILSRYADRDIHVGGHTALAGTAEGRQRLSLERAQVVADYFLLHNVRESGRMVVRGYGAERPIADNSTEQGMAQNRRVEITILEN
ncbi:MAG: OmpA family protein [Treponema sp.]|nr:OmpA family protein [Treponema sp.]